MKKLFFQFVFCLAASFLTQHALAQSLDQCNTTAQCKTLFGSGATDCRNSGAADSVCMCGASACAKAQFISASTFVAGSAFQIEVVANPSNGVTAVDLFVNGQFLRTELHSLYQWGGSNALDSSLRSLAAGKHSLKARVTYASGVKVEAAQQITLTAIPSSKSSSSKPVSSSKSSSSKPVSSVAPSSKSSSSKPVSSVASSSKSSSSSSSSVASSSKSASSTPLSSSSKSASSAPVSSSSKSSSSSSKSSSSAASSQSSLPAGATLWSDPNTWGGQVPADNASVTIPMGKIVYLDRAVNLSDLTVNGTLRCLDNTNLALTANWIMVHGTLECGTLQKPFKNRFEITLKGQASAPSVMGMGSKVLGAMGGGVLSLHGEQNREGWVRLDFTAKAGDQKINLDTAPNWRVGDTIFIASSTENYNQAELKRITAVSGRVITLDSPLQYSHFGEKQFYDNGKGKSWTVETRAEVGLLSRNIVIRGDADSNASRFGGHVMVMVDSKAYIDGVSFDDMGQEGVLGRYPFHWHFVGDGSGQYVSNSSIHNSFNRCVTIHQTDNTRVTDNVCYRHIGHGYFLEDGVEQNNVITGNLGAVGIRPREGKNILESDIMDKNAAAGPAMFWISNPKNIVNNNVAAGGDGSGFWYALDREDKQRYDGSKTHPAKDTYQEFHNNTAHSMKFGYTSCVFGGNVMGWESPNVVVRNLTTYMIRSSGNWPCSLITHRYENMMLLDSGGQPGTHQSAFTAPNHMIVADSLFVANSALATLNGGKKGRSAYGHYDQGTLIQGSHFVGYTSADKSPLIGFAGGAVKNTSNRMENVTMFPEKFLSYRDTDITSNQITRLYSSFHDDAAGSFTGVPNALLVPRHKLFDGLSECTTNLPRVETQTEALACQMRQMKVRTMNVTSEQATEFMGIRVDANDAVTRNKFSQGDPSGLNYIQGFAVPNKPFHFGVEFIVSPTANFHLILNQAHPNDLVMFEYRNISGFTPRGLPKVNSLNDVRNATGDAYYSDGQRILIKVKMPSDKPNWNVQRVVYFDR